MFFKKLKSFSNKINTINIIPKKNSLKEKQIFSFLSAYLNHIKLRNQIYSLLSKSNLLNKYQNEFLNFIHKTDLVEVGIDNINTDNFSKIFSEIYQKSRDNSIFQLFPYASKDYEEENALREINESINNLNTRLLNLKKINKSLDDIENNPSSLTWDELKNISFNLHNNDEALE